MDVPTLGRTTTSTSEFAGPSKVKVWSREGDGLCVKLAESGPRGATTWKLVNAGSGGMDPEGPPVEALLLYETPAGRRPAWSAGTYAMNGLLFLGGSVGAGIAASGMSGRTSAALIGVSAVTLLVVTATDPARGPARPPKPRTRSS